MIKVAMLGIWMPLATFASSYLTVNWLNEQSLTEQVDIIGGLDYETVQPVNVPMIADGALQGYVVVKMVFTADADALRSLSVPPHPFLVDEAFRRLYSDQSLDFRRLERYDLDTMKTELRETVNARLGQDIIHDVLVEEFNYFSKDLVITH
ncbi:hypothetical protein JM93_00466 [Roseibium hamelinense]|uniref:Uncharacterized protein n=1 Tax=Roseibium hamelinense TaxID=150831 RepID=A0A562TI29_9HYPH|nr:hypothetical protein [Roseibium hamelinense]MTI45901.1 hypothetical protein [Roseibium hamelinense]TWI92914.1 hypothetical protein JM93_00466 [Roseibium hamelinense]